MDDIFRMSVIITYVVPVFNSSKTIEKCINSIIKFASEKDEIIVVDDASTDNTVEILERLFCDQIVLKKNLVNRGVSYCRNLGIANSSGKYISFIDSDDVLIDSPVSSFYVSEEIPSVNADAFCFNYTINNESIETESYGVDSSYFNKGVEIIKKYLSKPKGNSILTYVWAKYYSVPFLNSNQIRFDEEIALHEDIVFNLNCFAISEKIMYSDRRIYNYVTSTGGLSSSGFERLSSHERIISEIDSISDSVLIASSKDLELMKTSLRNYFVVRQLSLAMRSGNYSVILRVLKENRCWLEKIDYKIITNAVIKTVFIFKVYKMRHLCACVLLLFGGKKNS